MDTMKLQKKTAVSTMLDPRIVVPAIGSSIAKLDPRAMIRKPTSTTRCESGRPAERCLSSATASRPIRAPSTSTVVMVGRISPATC